MTTSAVTSTVRTLAGIVPDFTDDALHAAGGATPGVRIPAAMTSGPANLPAEFRTAMTTFNQYVIATVRELDALQSGSGAANSKAIAQHSLHEAVQLATQMSGMFGVTAPARTAFTKGIEMGQRSLAALVAAPQVASGRLVADVGYVSGHLSNANKTGAAGLDAFEVMDALATVRGALGSFERGEAVAATHIEAMRSLATVRSTMKVGRFDMKGQEAVLHLDAARRLLTEVRPQPLYIADVDKARSLLINMQTHMGKVSTRVIVTDFAGMESKVPLEPHVDAIFRDFAGGVSLESVVRNEIVRRIKEMGGERGMDPSTLDRLAASVGMSLAQVDESLRFADDVA